MISFFRSIFGTKIGGFLALAFVVLIGIAFALGDVTGSFSPGAVGAGNVARVGDKNITSNELDSSLQNALRAQRRQNPTLDMGRFIAGGGLDQTLEQIINRYGLAVFGEKYNIGVSKRLVDSEIDKMPRSKGLDGKFDKEVFSAFLRQIGLTEKILRADISQNMHARQLLSIAVKGGEAPESLVLPYSSLVLESRKGKLAAIPSALFFPEKLPSDAVLAKFYKDNRAKFTIPEKRAISYAFFDKAVVAESAKPTEKQIADYYKENADEFAASEKRDFTQVIAPTEAAAKALSDKVAGGQALEAAAQAVGLSVAQNIGIDKADLQSSTSKTVADAVFAADANGLSKPAKGGLGWYVARVSKVTAIPARSLAQVTADISKLIEQEQSEEMIGELISEIEDQFSDGATLADMATAQKLKVETTPKLFANGQNPADRNYRPIEEMRAILPAAFNLEKAGDAQLIEIVPGERYAMISVAELEEAAPPPLSTVKREITAAWGLEQGSKQAKEAADKVVKSIAAGKSLNEAMAALKMKLPPVQSVSGKRSDLRQEGKQLSPPLALLFAMKKGSAKTLAAPGSNGWFVVLAEEIKRGDASGNKELLNKQRKDFGRLLQREYSQQFAASALADVGVEKNEDAIASLRARLTNTDGQ